MRQAFLIILLVCYSTFDMLACSCSFSWNDSFSRTAKNSDLVALVKILSFDEYLERDVLGHSGEMPYEMTAKIIKKYKGQEKREKISIVGDDGMLCRPYLSEFEINGYYLISPSPLDETGDTKYTFFSCRTDYLDVDEDSNIAYGKYTMNLIQIPIEVFERKMKKPDWFFWVVGSISGLLFLAFLFLKKNGKQIFR